MSTGQKYSGKGDSTTQADTNGSPIEQTVNSSPSAAQLDQQAGKLADQNTYGAVGLTKFFAKHPQLTVLQKKMLAALAMDGQAMKVIKDVGRQLLGAEQYKTNVNSSDMPDFSDLQEAYNLEDEDVEMLEGLFESGHSSEVIISKAKKLANFDETEDTPLATHYPQMSDEEFIDSLRRALDLTADDLLTVTGMVQMGCPRDLVERTANRFKQYPAIGNIISHVLDLKGDEVTPPTVNSSAKPESKLSATIEVSTNARFGNSHARVLLFALTEYQDSRLRQATKLIAEGAYVCATDELSDMECASTMITEFALSLSALADSNHWAANGQSPEGNDEPSKQFESYAKHYLGLSPERIQQHVNENY